MNQAQNARSKTITFHLAGHAHIDPVWLWDWREGLETVRATFRSALDRLKENPDMVFVHSSAAQYAWLEHFPDLLKEVQDAVKRGQWEPLGGWWVEPDVNLPHGESFARQALHGQRTFKRLLERRAEVGFLPDSFGHPPTLPQLLEQSGLNAFVFMRPNRNELVLPGNLFWWVGPDGTRILSARIEAYSSNPHHIESSLERNLIWRPEALKHWLGLYGVGNHGGGPTKRSIANMRELAEHADWPTLKLNGVEGFFNEVRGETLPEFRGELQHHARGCYAAVSEIKKLNRQAEHALIQAEKLAVMAAQSGYPYPQEALNRAWQRLLFNQFHDVLAGSSLERAYDDARHQIGEALAVASDVGFFAVQSIATQIDTRLEGRDPEEIIRTVAWDGPTWVYDYGDGVPLVVFNSSSQPRMEPLELELNDWHTLHLRLTDEAGQDVPYQLLQTESVNGGRPRFVFLAEVPTCGYRTYRVLAEPGAPHQPKTTLSATPTTLENEFLRLEFDPRSGNLRRLFDKRLGLERLAGQGAQVQVIRDDSDTWGHGVTSLRELVGLFGGAEVTLVENGPLRATIRAVTRWGASRVIQEFTLYAHSAVLYGKVTLDWQEPHHAAQLVFPLALSGVQATYEVPYGFAVRPDDGQEEPCGSWLDVSGQARDRRGQFKDAGAALLSDSKASASVLGGEMRLTLARSPIYAHHDPAVPDPERAYQHVDLGRQHLHWRFVPHAGDWRDAQIPVVAEHFLQPLRFTREHVHGGILPHTHSLIRLEGPEHVTVSALKNPEEGQGTILRLHEWAGKDSQGTLYFGKFAVEVDIRANQVLSLRLNPDGSVQRVNFVEDVL